VGALDSLYLVRLTLAGIVLTSCLGSNPPGSYPVDLSLYPDKGRTAVDDVVPGILGITFDDGPGPFTRDILDIVDRHHVPATFFMIGRNIAGYRSLLEEIRARGHQIGNHTYNHEPQVLLTRAQFEHHTRAVKTNIGDADGGRLFFRFPYGAAGDDQMQWLSELDVDGRHYRPVGWNADSQDWDFDLVYPDREFSAAVGTAYPECGGEANPFQGDYVGWTQFEARLNKGGVMLFHDITRITHEHLDAVLTYFEAPEQYWNIVAADKRDTYRRFYACAGADPAQRFEFRALSSGVWRSFAD
jgi:peptidoglycan/xylan/chitin deacetylase (PgdA/CDA1 family)